MNNMIENNIGDVTLDSQINHHIRQLNYYNYIKNANLANYDSDFFKFYHSGNLTIENQVYSVNDIYLEIGINNGIEKTLVICYKNPNNDILTNENKINFKRNSVLEFRNSYAFYKLYTLYKNLIINNTLILNHQSIGIILNLINTYKGVIHVEVPETSYQRINY